MNKTIKTGLISAIVVLACIITAGVIKFNLLNDDIVLAGSSVTAAAIAGTWVEPVPGREKEVQGFILTRAARRNLSIWRLCYIAAGACPTGNSGFKPKA